MQFSIDNSIYIFCLKTLIPPYPVLLVKSLLRFGPNSLTGAGRAHHGVRPGGDGERVPGEDAAGHRDRRRPGHRVRRGRGLRRVSLAGGGGRK